MPNTLLRWHKNMFAYEIFLHNLMVNLPNFFQFSVGISTQVATKGISLSWSANTAVKSVLVNRRISTWDLFTFVYIYKNETSSPASSISSTSRSSNVGIQKTIRHEMTHTFTYKTQITEREREGERREIKLCEKIELIEHVCLFCCVLINVCVPFRPITENTRIRQSTD